MSHPARSDARCLRCSSVVWNHQTPLLAPWPRTSSRRSLAHNIWDTALETRTEKFGNPAGESSEHFGHFGLNARALFRVARRGETDLHLVGVAGFAHDRAHADYPGTDPSSKSTAYSLGYGVEVQRWIGRRIAISLSAETTVLTSWRATQDGQGGIFSGETSQLSLAWNPQVRLQLHLYF